MKHLYDTCTKCTSDMKAHMKLLLDTPCEFTNTIVEVRHSTPQQSDSILTKDVCTQTDEKVNNNDVLPPPPSQQVPHHSSPSTTTKAAKTEMTPVKLKDIALACHLSDLSIRHIHVTIKYRAKCRRNANIDGEQVRGPDNGFF
jgi:hypothetical protein